MIPLLFSADTKDFTNNGIGGLTDAVDCTVTEERNGQFELEMQYPITGRHYTAIKTAGIILTACQDSEEKQPFRIYKITKPINGIVKIYAQHISYQLSHIPCMPFAASSAATALEGFKANATEECPFDFWTDVTTTGAYNQSIPASIRSQLGGVTGSILDVYGGEYEWDRYLVKLHASRGADRGVTLRYGKNIIDLEQEENIANTVTGVCPYWVDSEGNIVTLPEKALYASNANNYPFKRTITLDLSSEFSERPTVEALREKAQAYISQSGMGTPAVSISVSFVALWQTEEYKNIAPLERVELCDTVTVLFNELGVSAKAKVIKTVYNVLLERYETIELGEARTTLASTIADTNKTLQEKTSTSFLQAAVERTTGWITGANGGYVLLHKDGNGQPYEILIMDTPQIDTASKIWRWNSGGLGYSENGYNGPYKLAMTQDGEIVADFITAGTLDASHIDVKNISAESITAGILKSKDGKSFFNLLSGIVQFTGNLKSVSGDLKAEMWAAVYKMMWGDNLRARMYMIDGDKGGLLQLFKGTIKEDGTKDDTTRYTYLGPEGFGVGQLSDGSFVGEGKVGQLYVTKIAPTGNNLLTVDWVQVNKADGSGMVWALCGK